MATVTQFRCEICGAETASPDHWFMIRCNVDELCVIKWNPQTAHELGTRHYCGEAHAGIYISRWLEASCSPSKTDFNRKSGQ